MIFRSPSLTWKQWGCLLAVCISSQIEKSCAQISIIPKPENPTVGNSVVLPINYYGEIQIITWFRNRGTIDSMEILTYNPVSRSPPNNGPQYTGRETVLEDGSLRISNLMTNYSGAYTLQITGQNTYVVGTAELTVSHASANSVSSENPVPPLTNPDTGTGKYIGAVVGAVVGGVAVLGLFIAGLVIYIKKWKRRPTQQPIFDATKSSTEQTNQTSPTVGSLQPDMRRLPSIPSHNFPIESRTADEQQINSGADDYENPYMELTYEYQIAYDELQIASSEQEVSTAECY
ncbi:cell adhesion molecule CEACAM8-like [Discoglossus pictus]